MSLTIKQQLVSSRKFVIAGTNPVNWITVHDTANTGRGANAQAHANLQSRGNSRQASWHYQVDDTQAIQSFPDTVRCMHAGDGSGHGNMSSVAVEICINSDGNYKRSVENAVKLVAILADRHGVPASRIVQHNHWSGKICPRQIRNGRDGITWSKFLELVAAERKGGTAPTPAPKPKPTPAPKPTPSPSKSVATMADEVIAGRHGSGHANRQRSLGVSDAVYAQVRAEVNRRLGGGAPTPSRPAPTPAPSKPATKSVATMAQEVIDGKHGNGHANRQKSLGVNAATYAQVRAEVNRRAGGGTPARPAGKTVAQMATEVLAGKHGNGHSARQKSLGVSNAVYAQVRNEVNRRA